MYKCIFGVAGAVFGAYVFAAMRCINVLLGTWAEVKRGVFSVTRASSAQSFHFSLESLCAEPGAGSQARELLPVVLCEEFVSERQQRGVGL